MKLYQEILLDESLRSAQATDELTQSSAAAGVIAERKIAEDLSGGQALEYSTAYAPFEQAAREALTYDTVPVACHSLLQTP